MITFKFSVSSSNAVVGDLGSSKASKMAAGAEGGLAGGPYPSAIRVAPRRGQHTGAEARRMELLLCEEGRHSSKEIVSALVRDLYTR